MEDFKEQVLLLENRIIVRQATADEKTAGGIIIPDSYKKKPGEGVIVAMGSGLKNDKGEAIPMVLMIGDYVMFSQNAGTPLQIGGEDMLLMREFDIFIVLIKKSEMRVLAESELVIK